MPCEAPLAAVRLGAWAAGMRLRDVPHPTRAMAVRAAVDVVGVAHAGAAMPAAQALRNLAEAEAGDGPCRVIGGLRRLPPAAAALANAAAAHALDFDANFATGMVFAPATFIPGLLALAEAHHRSGGDLVLGFAVASEVARVLAHAVSPVPYSKAVDGLYRAGWFNTSVFGPVAAAAGAAAMLGLDAAQAAQAIAIAATQAGGLRIAVGSDMKVVLCAQAAERGVRAALLALAGLGAPDDAFEGPRGLADVVARGAWRGEALDTLGRFDDPGLSLKCYPACSSVQAAAEALEALLQREGLDPACLRTVTCEVTGHIAANLTYPRPANTTQAQFSMPFALACLLVHGRFTAAMLRQDVVDDPRIRAAIDKVRMLRDPALDAPELRATAPEATRVTVETDDGRRLSELRLSPTGRPATPMPDAQLNAKFLDNVQATLAPAAARALLARLTGLVHLDDLAGLFGQDAHAGCAA